MKQVLHVEDYEEQRKRRLSCPLEEHDMWYEQFSEERARIIAESAAPLLEVRRQAESERARYDDQVRLRKMEIQGIHRDVQWAEKNPYESPNAARLATAQLARTHAETVGVELRVWMPPPMHAVSPCESQHASPKRQANQRPTTNPEGVFPG